MKCTRRVVSSELAYLGLGVCAGAFATALLACAGPVSPAVSEPSEVRFELVAYDARGLEMPLDALARRPEFQLSSTRALEPVAFLLVTGEPDADLLDDLSALPLRAAHDPRLIPCFMSQQGPRLRIAPRIALAPNAAYTVALPGSARARGGAALGDGGPAFVAGVRTSGEPTAGATWVASMPAAAASGVPPNLSFMFVALDGDIEGGAAAFDDGVWVETPQGTSIPATAKLLDCAELDTRARTCVQLALGEALVPRTGYAVRSGRALRDAHAAPIEPLEAWFQTGSEPDAQPPTFESLPCLPDETETRLGCLLLGDSWLELRLRLDEPARLELSSHQRQAAQPADTPVGQRRIAQLVAAGDSSLTLDGFTAEEPFELRLTAIDLAGNATDASLESTTAARLATLSITEVLTDPDGSDAAHEYVEIANFGDAPVTMRGISLADPTTTKPSVVTSSVELAAGARALLVADDFDAAAATSGAAPIAPASGAAGSIAASASSSEPATESQPATIPPGTRLIRVGSSLTKGGLSNAGEQLFLRDQNQHRLSAVPMHGAPSGRCLQRRSTDPRSGAPEAFIEGPCTPGR